MQKRIRGYTFQFYFLFRVKGQSSLSRRCYLTTTNYLEDGTDVAHLCRYCADSIERIHDDNELHPLILVCFGLVISEYTFCKALSFLTENASVARITGSRFWAKKKKTQQWEKSAKNQEQKCCWPQRISTRSCQQKITHAGVHQT